MIKRICTLLAVVAMLTTLSPAVAEVTYPLDISMGGTGATSKGDALLSLGAGHIAAAAYATGIASIYVSPGERSAYLMIDNLSLADMLDTPADLANGVVIPICSLRTDYPQGRSCSCRWYVDDGLKIVAGLSYTPTVSTLVVVRWLVLVF